MGRIVDEDVTRVRDATDIVALVSERVVLKPKGRLFWGCCPFHQEKTPSFKVDPATGLWHCFGCGLGGDVFGFEMRVENVDFPDAVRILAERANIELHEESGTMPTGLRERLILANEAAADFYQRMLLKGTDAHAAAARAYLARRGFGSDVAKSFRLGWSPGRGSLVAELTRAGFTADELVTGGLAVRGDSGLRDRFYERVMFPIHDLQGRCIAFGGRVVGGGEPKYLNSAETPTFSKGRNLYAMDRAKATIVTRETAIVVEGYTDVIALHTAGVTNVVATLGTALTREHVKLLGRFAKRVVYLFDGDAAGMRAADRAVDFIDSTVTLEYGPSRMSIDVAVLPDGLDPADFIASEGAEALERAVKGAESLLKFAIDRRLARYDLGKPEERGRAVRDAAAVLAPVKGTTVAQDYANYIADALQRGYSSGMAVVDTAHVLAAIGTPPTERESAEPLDAHSERPEEPVTPQVQVELDLVGLLAQRPELRSGARELLDQHLLTDPTCRGMLEVIVRSAATLGSGLLDELTPVYFGAAQLLSPVAVADNVTDDPNADFIDLARKLKEFALERRIREVREMLEASVEAGPTDRPSEAELMQEYTRLTRELSDLETSRREARSS